MANIKKTEEFHAPQRGGPMPAGRSGRSDGRHSQTTHGYMRCGCRTECVEHGISHLLRGCLESICSGR